MREKFQRKQTVNDFRNKCNTKNYTLFNISTVVSPISTFSLTGNIIVYTPNQGTNREKHFNHIIYKGKMPTLAGNKHLAVQFFLHGARLFHFSTEKLRVQSFKKMYIKVVIPAPTKKKFHKQNIKQVFNKK